jgi:hypothetical protein
MRNEIRPANQGNPYIGSVALQKCLAKKEKIRVWQAVILEDDTGFFAGEEPVEGRHNSTLTPQILRLEKGKELAGPVDICRDRSNRFCSALVFGIPWTRTVRRDIQF